MVKAAGDEHLVDRVRAALTAVSQVKEKKMFGSVGFMVRGNLCVTARPSRIMCRIDPAAHSAAIKRKGCQSVVMKGRPYQGYVYVDAAAVRTEKALSYWITRALAFNRTLPRVAK
jgi:TfoX/Sxy family transcriptional regulator of competence genes